MAQYIKGKQIAAQTITISGNTGNVVAVGDLNMSSYNVILNNPPTLANQAANKAYVDSMAQGVSPHPPVLVADTAQITSALSGSMTIDGVAVVAGSRVLLTNQGGAGSNDFNANNGIWVVEAGAWTRPTDFNNSIANDAAIGDFVFVETGTTNASTGWVLGGSNTTTGETITVGTDTQWWTKIAAPGTYYTDGNALKLTGNEFYVQLADATLSQSVAGLQVSPSLSTVISQNVTTISTETSNRISADNSIVALISSDVSSLSTSISGGLSSLSTVVSTADSSLSVAISTGNSSLSTAISSAVSTEKSDVISLSTVISGAVLTGLSTEASIRLSADNSLSSAISTNLSNELSTETSLSTAIVSTVSNEASIRLSADNSIVALISGDFSSVSTAISSIVVIDSSLSTADSSLSTAISTSNSSLSSAISTGDSSVIVLLSTAISTGDSSVIVLSVQLQLKQVIHHYQLEFRLKHQQEFQQIIH